MAKEDRAARVDSAFDDMILFAKTHANIETSPGAHHLGLTNLMTGPPPAPRALAQINAAIIQPLLYSNRQTVSLVAMKDIPINQHAGRAPAFHACEAPSPVLLRDVALDCKKTTTTEQIPLPCTANTDHAIIDREIAILLGPMLDFWSIWIVHIILIICGIFYWRLLVIVSFARPFSDL